MKVKGKLIRKSLKTDKAEWLDSGHTAPNDTQYKTFQSIVLGREVSYLVWLPPSYAQ